MKLISKYNRVTIPIIIAVLLSGSIAYYFILHRILVYQLDKDLRIEQTEIIHHLKETGQLPETSDFKDQQISFSPTTKKYIPGSFRTQTVYNKAKDETESFRRIDFLVTQGGQNYIATVRKSQQETENLVSLILKATFLIILILLLILFVSNRFLLRKLWAPFRNTLTQITQFNFTSKNEIKLQPTDVDEFTELNETVIQLTRKLTLDYENLKSFTENASHEIQTPLAIITNKIEWLLQSENLSENDMKVLQSVNEAALKLSRLNSSLLLLAKIENRQFDNVESVDFSCMLKRYLCDYEELLTARGIRMEENVDENVRLKMNETLAEILISNLISNAIKHNVDGGSIRVKLDNNFFRVSNTGNELLCDSKELFQRFKKNSLAPDSLGLGLSIVKTITEIYHFKIDYCYKDRWHYTEISFRPPVH
ncbi:MAG TPA: HAMP domain-containing sensor histidine kinase [Hanamia sp.]|nr:HAMP domain-containing sensor histidine kinase [Hanamia sp.]